MRRKIIQVFFTNPALFYSGDTYGPAMALKEEVDLASIKLPHLEANSELVFFDTETTGLGGFGFNSAKTDCSQSNGKNSRVHYLSISRRCTDSCSLQ